MEGDFFLNRSPDFAPVGGNPGFQEKALRREAHGTKTRYPIQEDVEGFKLNLAKDWVRLNCATRGLLGFP